MSFTILSILLFIFGQISGNFFQYTQEEPQCLSRFDHDFKVLQKLVELDQKIMTVDQRSTVVDLEKKLNELERRLSSDPDQGAHKSWTPVVFGCFIGTNVYLVGPGDDSRDKYIRTHCPGEWTYYNNSCYSFFNDMTMSWPAALQHCETHGEGSHLVTIETSLEQIFLQRYVKRLAKSVGSVKLYYWVGATDTAEEGVYVWQPTGQLVSDTGAFWYPGQNPGSPTQDCAVLWGDSDYTMHDFYCEKPGFFICEKRFYLKFGVTGAFVCVRCAI